jgi:hypothetical protein
MNRWNFKPLACIAFPFPIAARLCHRRAILAFGTALALSAFVLPDASAQLSIQTRKLPEKVKTGELVVVQPPVVKLDGKNDQLAPGARIYGTDNLLVLSGTLINKPVKIAYLKDNYGLIHQVWILTDAEKRAAKLD